MKKHAFLIVGYKDYNQIIRLLKKLDDPRHDFYIHINKTSADFNEDMFLGVLKFSNIYFLERRNLYWGDPKLINVHMDFFEQSLKIGYQYYHYLTGQCFPIKSNDYINDFFDKYNNHEFVQIAKVKKLKWYLYSRYAYDQVFQSKMNSKLIKKSFYTALRLFYSFLQMLAGKNKENKYNFKIKYGFAFFSISDNFARYVLSKKDFVLKFYENSFAPDESYLQSLLFNSDFINSVAINSSNNRYYCARLIDFSDRKFGSGHPKTYTIEDKDTILKSKCIFARKFDINVDDKILDFLESGEINDKQCE